MSTYCNLTMRWDESFADDLIVRGSAVSSRVALLLRSAEANLLSSRFVVKHKSPLQWVWIFLLHTKSFGLICRLQWKRVMYYALTMMSTRLWNRNTVVEGIMMMCICSFSCGQSMKASNLIVLWRISNWLPFTIYHPFPCISHLYFILPFHLLPNSHLFHVIKSAIIFSPSSEILIFAQNHNFSDFSSRRRTLPT